MDKWQRKHGGDADDCWDEVIRCWFDRGSEDYPLSWEGLYELLNDVEYAEVARELKKAVAM